MLRHRLLGLMTVATVVAACDRAPSGPGDSDQPEYPAGPEQSQSAAARVEAAMELARGFALALQDDELRGGVRDAMRASLLTEHKLPFAEFVSSTLGQRVIAAAAKGLGRPVDQVHSLIAGLPELDFYVPASEHRLSWKGQKPYLVAAMVTQERPKTAFRPNGTAASIDFSRAPDAYPALLLLQYAEAKGRRVKPQAATRGLTIQDSGDGQISGLVPVRGADGNFEWRELADLAASGNRGTAGIDFEICTPETCGGGGGGGGSPVFYTYLSQFQTINLYDGTVWEGNEFEFRAVGSNNARLYGDRWPRIEGVPPNGVSYPNLQVLQYTPDQLAYIRVPVYETDFGTDDFYVEAVADQPLILRSSSYGNEIDLWRDNFEDDYPSSNTARATFIW